MLTSNLDSKSAAAIIHSFKRAQCELNATIFMVTHDSFAAAYCDTVIMMKDSVINQILNNPGNVGRFQDQLLIAIQSMSEGRHSESPRSGLRNAAPQEYA